MNIKSGMQFGGLSTPILAKPEDYYGGNNRCYNQVIAKFDITLAPQVFVLLTIPMANMIIRILCCYCGCNGFTSLKMLQSVPYATVFVCKV